MTQRHADGRRSAHTSQLSCSPQGGALCGGGRDGWGCKRGAVGAARGLQARLAWRLAWRLAAGVRRYLASVFGCRCPLRLGACPRNSLVGSCGCSAAWPVCICSTLLSSDGLMTAPWPLRSQEPLGAPGGPGPLSSHARGRVRYSQVRSQGCRQVDRASGQAPVSAREPEVLRKLGIPDSRRSDRL